MLTQSRRIVFFDVADLIIWSEEKQKQYEQSAIHALRSGYKGWELVGLGQISMLASQMVKSLGYRQRSDFLSE